MARWSLIGAAFAILTAAETLVYDFVRSKGVTLTGDEPHYLVMAKALTEWSVHPLKAYQADIASHHLYDWPRGMALTNANLHLWPGPHGPVSTHGLGLAAMLAPFVAVGGRPLALLGLFAIESAGFVYFFVRATRLAGLSRSGQLVSAILMAGPAVWLAGTQIYPDLMAGILIGCALVDIATLEYRGRLDPLGAAVIGFSIAMLPWLHFKNLVPALILLAALAVVAVRAHRTRALIAVGAIAAVSYLLLFAYNLYDFGHLSGLPQPFPSLNKAGIELILGLMFDRHQGLFVQVPTAALGLVGLWLARRSAPWAVAATLLASASLIYLNGTYIHAPYGGTSPAGRFEWSALPPLLVWCPQLVRSLQSVQGQSVKWRARAWAVAAVAAALWLLESVPILRGQHVYFNQVASVAPWDPSAYPGWWGRFDVLLPELVPGGRSFGLPWFALPFEVVLLAVAVALVRRATIADRAFPVVAGAAALAVAAVGLVALTLAAPTPLPSHPLLFGDTDLGGPLVSGPRTTATGPMIPLQGVGRGTFQVTVAYTLDGPPSTFVSAVVSCGNKTSSSLAVSTPGTHVAASMLRCSAGTISFEMSAGPNTTLAVNQLTLTKTSNGT